MKHTVAHTVHDAVLAVADESGSGVVKVTYLDEYRHGQGYMVQQIQGKSVFIKLDIGDSIKQGDMIRVLIGDKLDMRLGKVTGVVLGYKKGI